MYPEILHLEKIMSTASTEVTLGVMLLANSSTWLLDWKHWKPWMFPLVVMWAADGGGIYSLLHVVFMSTNTVWSTHNVR